MPKEPVLYEAMYILRADLDDAQIATIEEKLQTAVENRGGKVESCHLFGRRRLAYQIDGHTEGIYRVMYFRGEGVAVDEVKHEFGLTEEIIRGTVLIANPRLLIKDEEPAAPEEAEAEGEEPAEGGAAEAEEPAEEAAEGEEPAEEAATPEEAEAEAPEPAEEAAEAETPAEPADEAAAEPEAEAPAADAAPAEEADEPEAP